MNEVSNKDLGFSSASTSSFPVNPSVESNADVSQIVSDNNSKVPLVPLTSADAINGTREHWLPRYTVDELFLEMCERGAIVDDPGILSSKANGGKINYYYLQAAKYAFRISAGNFDGENARHKPVFEIHYKDFTPRLQDELLLLMKQSPSTLMRVVENAVFRIFKARHTLIFYQYIENEGLNWRFIDN